jgi:hypothetical protein
MEQIQKLTERIKQVKLRSYHKAAIGNLRLELVWEKAPWIPKPRCFLTIVDTKQSRAIRSSVMESNSFFADLSRENLIALRTQIDEVLLIIDETISQIGTDKELENLQVLEKKVISQAWERAGVSSGLAAAENNK